jgi:hypothetical protein
MDARAHTYRTLVEALEPRDTARSVCTATLARHGEEWGGRKGEEGREGGREGEQRWQTPLGLLAVTASAVILHRVGCSLRDVCEPIVGNHLEENICLGTTAAFEPPIGFKHPHFNPSAAH